MMSLFGRRPYQPVAGSADLADMRNGDVHPPPIVKRWRWPYLCGLLIFLFAILAFSQKGRDPSGVRKRGSDTDGEIGFDDSENERPIPPKPSESDLDKNEAPSDGQEIDGENVSGVSDEVESTDEDSGFWVDASPESTETEVEDNAPLSDQEGPEPSGEEKQEGDGDKNDDDVFNEQPPVEGEEGEATENSETEAVNASEPSLLPSKRGIRNWFLFDKPGMDPIEPGRALTMWNFEVSATVGATRGALDKRHPEFAFVKGLKVGGTTVAVALDHAARLNGIRLQRGISELTNIRGEHPVAPCTLDGSLWFHHGFRARWMKKCMPNVRYLTTIREPISQALSWESMQINHNYYRNYPGVKCRPGHRIEVDHKKHTPNRLKYFLGLVHGCVATEYRKNITLMIVAHLVESWPAPSNNSHGWPGPAVALTANWYLGSREPRYHQMKPGFLIEVLKNNFYLVAPVERMSEFLVLLALHMGWKYESLYYISCKPQDLDVHRSDFAKYFPGLTRKLDLATKPMGEAYKWAKENWDSHVERLGPWFREEVKKYEVGLAKYQQAHHHNYKYRWSNYRYLDGHSEDC